MPMFVAGAIQRRLPLAHVTQNGIHNKRKKQPKAVILHERVA